MSRVPWPATPYVVGVVLLVLLPAGAVVVLAFTDYSAVGPTRFVGFDNFARMFADRAFLQALGNTAFVVAVAVPVRLVLVAVCGLLLSHDGLGSTTARALVYLPLVVPEVAYALFWSWLLNPLYGPAAAFTESTGLPSPGWLTDPWAARVALAFIIASQLGEAFVIVLAWRRSFPRRLYEQAAVEGAGPWFTLTRVTLPMTLPVLALLALRDVLLVVQASFVPALLVTGGGPRKATTTVSLYVYDQAFRYLRLGYAAALSCVVLVLGAAVLLAALPVVRRVARVIPRA